MSGHTTLIPLWWMRPFRGRVGPQRWMMQSIIAPLRDAALQHGLDLRVVDLDDIAVAGSPDSLSVYVEGVPVDPISAIFHTKTTQTAAAATDQMRHTVLVELLEAGRYHVTVPARLNLINDDKLLAVTTYGAGLEYLPSIRLHTRQFDRLLVPNSLITYPAIVKPTSWSAGLGVRRVESYDELQAVLQLAGASESTMLVQPFMGENTRDIRVYCVDGRPHCALLRSVSGDAVAANLSRGGTATVGPVPPELVEPAALVARRVGAPYIGVDFLQNGSKTVLSEIEVDAGSVPFPELHAVRFSAMKASFDRWLPTRVE